MSFQPNLISIIYFVSSVAILVPSILLWRSQDFPGRKALSAALLACAEWALAAAMVNAVGRLEDKILWAKIEYIGALSAPILLFLFSGYYTGYLKQSGRYKLAAIWIVPAITFVLALTNEAHGLVWSGFESSRQIANLVIFHHGLFFYIWVAYVYACMLLTLFIQAHYFVNVSPVFRNQARLLLLSNIFPWVVNLAFVLRLNPFPGLDITPMSFILAGVMLAWGILRHRLFDLLPVARDVLASQMTDGFLVIDGHGRVVDVNQAAIRYFGLSGPVIGSRAADVFAAHPQVVEFLSDREIKHAVLHIRGEVESYFDAQQIDLETPPGAVFGRLLTFHDITRMKEVETALEHKTNELWRKTVLDDLTGLFNRRHALEFLEEQCRLARRYPDAIFSVGFFDLDEFKSINDRFGHAFGDRVLVRVAELSRAVIRETDLAVRLGGDEFLVVFPHTRADEAWAILERLRLEAARQVFEQGSLRITISGGVVEYADGAEVESILSRADNRLYQAKQDGRNRITRYSPHEFSPAGAGK
jgi:diguanylate cyclase (GGDEF)-like protein